MDEVFQDYLKGDLGAEHLAEDAGSRRAGGRPAPVRQGLSAAKAVAARALCTPIAGPRDWAPLED
eukprot:11192640-Lingulodinium_polyedra.AAC.1